MKIRSSRFWNNSASDKGAAIHVENARHTLDVADTVFDSNQVRAAESTARCGGCCGCCCCSMIGFTAWPWITQRLPCESLQATMRLAAVVDPLFCAVSLTCAAVMQGGGVGGAIACTTSLCLLNNCTFTNNSAGSLGGAFWSSSATGMEINSSSITGNKVGRRLSRQHLNRIPQLICMNITVACYRWSAAFVCAAQGDRLFVCCDNATNVPAPSFHPSHVQSFKVIKPHGGGS